MNLSTWLLYLAVTLIQVLSPGPAIILAVSNGMTLGLHKAVFSSLGNITGLLLLSIAAMIGLGAILKNIGNPFYDFENRRSGLLILSRASSVEIQNQHFQTIHWTSR